MGPWLRLFRIRLLPSAVSNLLLGATLAGGDLPGVAVLACGIGVAVLLYLFGMGLNDVRDRRRDRTLHPERPLPAGVISLPAAGAALGVIAGATGLLTLEVPPGARIWAALTALAILAYDLLLKDRPLVGPLAMGSVRFALVGFGAALHGDPLPAPRVWIAAAVVGTYVFAVTRFSLEEEDARPTVLRRRVIGATAVLLLAAATTIGSTLRTLSPGPLVAAGLAWLGLSAWLVWRSSTPLRGPRPRPQLTTFRMLLTLPALDMVLLVTYGELAVAAVSGGLWLWVMWGFPFPAGAAQRRENPVRPAPPEGPLR